MKETNLAQILLLLNGRSLLKLYKVTFWPNSDTKKKVSLVAFRLQINLPNVLRFSGAEKVHNELYRKCVFMRECRQSSSGNWHTHKADICREIERNCYRKVGLRVCFLC